MIIAVVSKKGGVGKTTTVTSLGAAMAERGQRVLIVDLDPQCSSSLSLGLRRVEMAPSAADVLLRSTTAEEAIQATTLAGLDVLPGSTDLLHADHELAPLRDRERILTRRLEALRERYDWIFIDCAPSLSVLPTNAIVAADHYLVPTTPHFLASEGIENLVRAVHRIGKRNQTTCRLLGVALTMVDYRTRLTNDNVRTLRESFGSDVLGIEIRVNVRLAEAPQLGKSIFEHAPNSTGASAYRLLAEEIDLRVGASAEPIQDEATEATEGTEVLSPEAMRPVAAEPVGASRPAVSDEAVQEQPLAPPHPLEPHPAPPSGAGHPAEPEPAPTLQDDQIAAAIEVIDALEPTNVCAPEDASETEEAEARSGWFGWSLLTH